MKTFFGWIYPFPPGKLSQMKVLGIHGPSVSLVMTRTLVRGIEQLIYTTTITILTAETHFPNFFFGHALTGFFHLFLQSISAIQVAKTDPPQLFSVTWSTFPRLSLDFPWRTEGICGPWAPSGSQGICSNPFCKWF